jgi:hypothetical protein
VQFQLGFQAQTENCFGLAWAADGVCWELMGGGVCEELIMQEMISVHVNINYLNKCLTFAIMMNVLVRFTWLVRL